MMTTDDCKRALAIAKTKAALYPTGVVINLAGPMGNIFYIQGICNQVMHELRLDATERNKFEKELEGKRYKERLQIITKWFGFVYINSYCE